MFIHRALSAVVIVSTTALFVYLGGIPFALFIGVIAAIAARELGGMFAKTGPHPLIYFSIAAILALTLDAHLGAGLASPIILLAILLPLGWQTLMPRSPREATAGWVLTPLVALYIGLPMSHFVLLRASNAAPGLADLPVGLWWTLLAIVGTWASDTGAYITGMLVGRRPFMAHISPHKTWEGVVGSVVATVAVGIAMSLWALNLSPWHGVVAGMLISSVATIGDLGESLIKRGTGVKDTGAIIPGHGGMLDRLDSLIFTGPVTYYYMLWIANR